MNSRSAHQHQPVLIADDLMLDRYLADYSRQAHRGTHQGYAGVDLATWLASGEGADEFSWAQASQLGLPLVRLPAVSADARVAALLRPQQALARAHRAAALAPGPAGGGGRGCVQCRGAQGAGILQR